MSAFLFLISIDYKNNARVICTQPRIPPTEKNAERMTKKHDHKRNKRTLEFNCKDPVSIAIPRIDRGGTDLRRIPGVVTRIAKHNNVEFYEITTAYGILNDCLRASALEDYAGVIDFDPNTIKNKIALTSAAQLAGNRDRHIKQIQVSCNCKTTSCADARCKCYKNKMPCSSHCHGSATAVNCCNKENL